MVLISQMVRLLTAAIVEKSVRGTSTGVADTALRQLDEATADGTGSDTLRRHHGSADAGNVRGGHGGSG